MLEQEGVPGQQTSDDLEAHFLGWLAFPAPGESQNRNRFVASILEARQRNSAGKEIPVKLQEKLNPGLRRIVNIRILAAWMALTRMIKLSGNFFPRLTASQREAAAQLEADFHEESSRNQDNIRKRVWKPSEPVLYRSHTRHRPA